VRIELLTNLCFGIACVNLGNNNIDGGTLVAYVEEGEGGGGWRMHHHQGGEEIMVRFLSQRHARLSGQGYIATSLPTPMPT
jgi:hypothetical protein